MSDQNQGGPASELRGRIKWFNPEKGFGFVTPADGAPEMAAGAMTPVQGALHWFVVSSSNSQAQAATDTLFQIIREPDVRHIKGDSPDDRIFRSRRIQLNSAKTGTSSLSRQFEQPLVALMCLVGVVLLTLGAASIVKLNTKFAAMLSGGSFVS